MYTNLSLAAAIGLGVLHSLEPGHGKGVMSAYIISTRANAVQAVLLGLIAALSHALSIFLLAWLAGVSVLHFTPGQLSHWLELLSGLFILIIGGLRLKNGLKDDIVTVRKWAPKNLHSNAHHLNTNSHGSHGHSHDRHFHYHPKKAPTNLRQFVTVGFLTGIIPCPSALAIILAAMSSHHLLVGIQLVIAFSIGGALTMACIGFAVSHASHKVKKTDHVGFIKFMTVASACLILFLGGGVLVTALYHLMG